MNITTTRCTLRRFLEQDLHAFMEYRNNSTWMQYQGYKGKTRKEYEEFLLADRSPWEGMQLAIVRNDTGELLGDVYLQLEEGAYWIGYTIHPKHARKGYAKEAALGLLSWIRSQGGTVAKAGVLPENIASIALLEGLGFQKTGTDASGEWIYALPLNQ